MRFELGWLKTPSIIDGLGIVPTWEGEIGSGKAQFPLGPILGRKESGPKRIWAFCRTPYWPGGQRGFLWSERPTFLGHEAFVDNVHGSLNEQPQSFYDIPLGQIVSEVSSLLDISADLLYSPNRNRQGALGRAVWDMWEGNWVAIRLGGLQNILNVTLWSWTK